MKPENKLCSRCKQEYPTTSEFFVKSKKVKGGLTSDCKKCRRKISILYHHRHKKAESLYKKEYYQKRKRNCGYDNKKISVQHRKRYYKLKQRDSSEIKYPCKKRCSGCGIVKSGKEFYKQKCNKDGLRSRCKQCCNLYRESHLTDMRQWSKNYYKNPYVRFRKNLSRRVNLALRDFGVNKNKNVERYVGCSIEFLREYIEKLFTDNMSWGNYGSVWHLDHIKPCISFDLTQEDEQKKCFHYSNLQPLNVSNNLSKSSNYNGKIIRKNKLISC